MRIFPGKLDLSILSVGGEADTGIDLAGRPWIKSGNKKSSSSELLLSTLSLILLATPVTLSRLALLGNNPL